MRKLRGSRGLIRTFLYLAVKSANQHSPVMKKFHPHLVAFREASKSGTNSVPAENEDDVEHSGADRFIK